MSDWSSYDIIAARYDDVWGSRFEAVARLLCERMPPGCGTAHLDVGTGTGIVLRALASRASGSSLAGCDRSIGMIRAARARVPEGRFVAADAMTLPFRDASFDAVTASFVLSHIADLEAGLQEAHRVLKPGGRFAMTSWSADADRRAEAWRELLAGTVSRDLVRAAVASVAPREAQLESAESVEGALAAARFSGVQVHAVVLEYTISLDDFLADREISSAGRYARHTLGPDGWSRWVAHARDRLERRFGSAFECSRGVLIGLGARAA